MNLTVFFSRGIVVPPDYSDIKYTVLKIQQDVRNNIIGSIDVYGWGEGARSKQWKTFTHSLHTKCITSPGKVGVVYIKLIRLY